MAASPRETLETVLGIWSRNENLPADLLDREIEWVNPYDAVEPGTRRGHGGFRRAQVNWRESFSSVRFEIERVATAGDEVAAAVRCYSVARGSGVEVERVLGFLLTVRDGHVARFEWSNEADELLERIGGSGS